MSQLSYYGMTDPGRCRENNEDAYLLERKGSYVIAAVADGIGGDEGGEVASYLACKCISDYLRDSPEKDLGEDVLKQAVIYANNVVVSQQQNPRLSSMGCVLTAVLFDMEQHLAYMCHVGDTRLYKYKDGVLTKLSRDHSLVGFQEDAGVLSEEEAISHPRRNIITRFIGNSRLYWNTNYMMDLSFPIEADTQYLICSDGLYDMVTSAKIMEVLAQEGNQQQKVEALINRANLAGGKDNITAIILETK
jgi:serine/threonine protein phosphatase PrpC